MNRRVVLPTLLFGVAAGCNRSKSRVIGVVAQGQTHLFWQSVHAGAVAASREAGVEVLWNAPAKETEYNSQLQIVDSMVNRHVDAIAVSPIDKKSLVSAIERATREGIPVVIFDTGIDTDVYVARVATDNYGAGRLAAERMGKILNGSGEMIMVACQPGSASTLAREQGFEDALKEHFPGIRIVDKRFGMSDFAKSLAVTENMLTAQPGVSGLFASNETSSVGAAQALKGRASKVKMVGFDWSPTLLADLKGGLIDSLVVQDPFKIGHDSVIAAVAKLTGKPVVKEQSLPPLLVTKENLEDAVVQAQLNPDLKKYLN